MLKIADNHLQWIYYCCTKMVFSKVNILIKSLRELGCTDIHFIELGVKVNGTYYCDNLLSQKLLPDMRRLAQVDFLCGPPP